MRWFRPVCPWGAAEGSLAEPPGLDLDFTGAVAYVSSEIALSRPRAEVRPLRKARCGENAARRRSWLDQRGKGQQ